MNILLKVRIIPVLTFNGFGLIKTKQFSNPRMVGNPVQAARVYNSRGVDELAFIDIYASKQKRSTNLPVIRDILKECFMPVSIGGGISTLEDINNLLKIGADKVIIKKLALTNPDLIKEAVNFFGSQCITIATDAKKYENGYFIYNEFGMLYDVKEFIPQMEDLGAGEFIVNSVDNDGLMNGFDISLILQCEKLTKVPIVAVGGGGLPGHFTELFSKTGIEAVGAASIFHFSQYTPNDIKIELNNNGIPIRVRV